MTIEIVVVVVFGIDVAAVVVSGIVVVVFGIVVAVAVAVVVFGIVVVVVVEFDCTLFVATHSRSGFQQPLFYPGLRKVQKNLK